jgi:hypothetical protein
MAHEKKGEGRDGLLPPSPSARASGSADSSSSSDVVADNSNGRSSVVQPAARRPTNATATHADIELAPRSYNPVGSAPLGSSLGQGGGFGSGPAPVVRRASPHPHHPHTHLRHGSHEEPLSADEEEQIKMESQISMLLAAARSAHTAHVCVSRGRRLVRVQLTL